MFDEAKKSLEKNLNDKLVSPFWGAFIASWLVWNWKTWYITFFIDTNVLMQTKNVLKVDYILSFYPSEYYQSFAYSVAPPLIASYVIVFWLPKITKFYYKKALDFEYENKILKEKKDQMFLREKEIKLVAEEKVLEKEEKVEKIKTKTQEEMWDRDYDNFKETRFFRDFPTVRDSIYIHNGYTYWDNYRMASEVVAYFHANNIVEGASGEGNRLRITEKGKYFIKKYLAENNA